MYPGCRLLTIYVCQTIPGCGMAVINVFQTIPWVQFGYDMCMPNHTLGNVSTLIPGSPPQPLLLGQKLHCVGLSTHRSKEFQNVANSASEIPTLEIPLFKHFKTLSMVRSANHDPTLGKICFRPCI